MWGALSATVCHMWEKPTLADAQTRLSQHFPNFMREKPLRVWSQLSGQDCIRPSRCLTFTRGASVLAQVALLMLVLMFIEHPPCLWRIVVPFCRSTGLQPEKGAGGCGWCGWCGNSSRLLNSSRPLIITESLLWLNRTHKLDFSQH